MGVDRLYGLLDAYDSASIIAYQSIWHQLKTTAQAIVEAGAVREEEEEEINNYFQVILGIC